MSVMTSCDDDFGALALCIPRLGLASLARVSFCTKQLGKHCSENLTAAKQQQAALLLLQAVRAAAQKRMTPSPDPANADSKLTINAK